MSVNNLTKEKEVAPCSSLPKEPHPVRDQTVHRRATPRDSQPATSSPNNIRLCLPPMSPRQLCRGLSSETAVKDDDHQHAEGLTRSCTPAPRRLRWLFRRREAAGRRRREKPSSALKKEIKAATSKEIKAARPVSYTHLTLPTNREV